MQNARVHCREDSCAYHPNFRTYTTHTISQDASKRPRRKLSCQFDPQVRIRVHNSMAVKNQQQLWFFIYFPVIFSVSTILCVSTALRLQHEVVMLDAQLVACDAPFQGFIAFVCVFPVSARLPSQIFIRSEQFRYNLGTKLFMSKYSLKIVWTDDFPKPSSSAIIVTVNRRSLSTRGRTRSMFSLPIEVEGRTDLTSSFGSSRPSRKRWTHLKTVISFRAHSP